VYTYKCILIWYPCAQGLERLKTELTRRGLKCGGSLSERAVRLFLLKSMQIEEIPKQHLAKKNAAHGAGAANGVAVGAGGAGTISRNGSSSSSSSISGSSSSSSSSSSSNSSSSPRSRAQHTAPERLTAWPVARVRLVIVVVVVVVVVAAAVAAAARRETKRSTWRRSG